MKISPDTIAILKNFASINQNILIKKGSVIYTIAQQKNNFGKAQVAEKFPVDIAIYDLNEFLSAVSLFTDPEFEFAETFVTITQDKSKASIKYFYADPQMLVLPKKYEVEFPKAEVSFEMTEEDLESVRKAGQVLQVPELAVIGKGGKITFEALDTANNTSNGYSIKVGSGKVNFTAVFKKENLTLLKGAYKVEVSSKGISHWTNDAIKLEYWTSLEQNSKFDAEKPATKKATNGK